MKTMEEKKKRRRENEQKKWLALGPMGKWSLDHELLGRQPRQRHLFSAVSASCTATDSGLFDGFVD